MLIRTYVFETVSILPGNVQLVSFLQVEPEIRGCSKRKYLIS